MFSIELYNHETKTNGQRFEFKTKKEANKFVNKHAEKVGYDFHCKNDFSVEYKKLY